MVGTKAIKVHPFWRVWCPLMRLFQPILSDVVGGGGGGGAERKEDIRQGVMEIGKILSTSQQMKAHENWHWLDGFLEYARLDEDGGREELKASCIAAFGEQGSIKKRKVMKNDEAQAHPKEPQTHPFARYDQDVPNPAAAKLALER